MSFRLPPDDIVIAAIYDVDAGATIQATLSGGGTVRGDLVLDGGADRRQILRTVENYNEMLWDDGRSMSVALNGFLVNKPGALFTWEGSGSSALFVEDGGQVKNEAAATA